MWKFFGWLFLIIILFAGLAFFYNHGDRFIQIVNQFKFPGISKLLERNLVPPEQKNPTMTAVKTPPPTIVPSAYAGRVRIQLRFQQAYIYLEEGISGEVNLTGWVVSGPNGNQRINASAAAVIRPAGGFSLSLTGIGDSLRGYLELRDPESRIVDRYSY